MDLPLHSCRPRLLSECCSRSSSQVLSRRVDLSRGFIPVRARKSVKIVNRPAIRVACGVCSIRGSGRFVHSHSATRVSSESCGWRRVGRKCRVLVSGRELGRSKFGIARFEQGDRNCSDGSATNSEDRERPPFDLDLAVVLAGFAFEAYNSPPVRVPLTLTLCFPILSNLLSNFWALLQWSSNGFRHR